jgi:tRNA(adenine34) deaminase
MKENSFMAQALAEARAAGARGEVPVGAVLVCEDRVLAAAGNEVEERKNPAAHAEMLVLARGLVVLDRKRLDGCDIYITLEPCAMCAGAIALHRIGRLYYGARDKKMGGIDFFRSPTCHHRPEIYDGIAQAESQALLKAFFEGLRKNQV